METDTETLRCPHCDKPAEAGHVFCEECGKRLDGTEPDAPETPAAPPEPVLHTTTGGGRWLSSSAAGAACPACGDTRVGAEGYCDNCGARRQAGADHTELTLDTVAGVTDRGLRKAHNEDALALGELPAAGDRPLTVLAVVCDGVSSSSRADSASHAAVDAAMATLLTELAGADGTDPDGARRASTTAAATARVAVAAAAADAHEPNPPSSTYVSAVVTPARITVGWIGDSRAYWLPDDGEPARLTADDSLAGQLAASGMPVEQANADPQAGALVRWLGADADDDPPRLTVLEPDGPGHLVVCSDGLSRYRSEPAELAAAMPGGPPAAVAATLVGLARSCGGVDNITAVVLPFPPHREQHPDSDAQSEEPR